MTQYLIGSHTAKCTPELIAQARTLATQGVLPSRLPYRLGIAPVTFYRLCRKNKGLAEAVFGGAQQALGDVEIAIFQNATQPAIGPNGNPVGPPGGSIDAQKFILARRGGKRWQEVRDDGDGIKSVDGNVQIVINLPDNQRPVKVIDAV